MSENLSTFEMMQLLMNKQDEARRQKETESQACYAERRKEKLNYRKEVEQAASQVCAMVELEAKKHGRSPNDIALLAAALNSATQAVVVAENYAEAMPQTTYALGHRA